MVDIFTVGPRSYQEAMLICIEFYLACSTIFLHDRILGQKVYPYISGDFPKSVADICGYLVSLYLRGVPGILVEFSKVYFYVLWCYPLFWPVF